MEESDYEAWERLENECTHDWFEDCTVYNDQGKRYKAMLCNKCGDVEFVPDEEE